MPPESYEYEMNRIIRAPWRTFRALALALLLIGGTCAVPAQGKPADREQKENVVWGEMPAGAKTTYIGIHGGTVPVSLLTAGDGSPMIALVGLTGSDFLNFIRSNGKLPEEPLFADASGTYAPSQRLTCDDTLKRTTGDDGFEDLPATENPAASDTNATLLLAGSSVGDIPVIYATGRRFERMSLVPANWAPFGLTEKALSLEGEVKVLAPPKKMPRTKKRRHN